MQPRAVVALSRKLLCTGRCSDTMECRFLQRIMQLCSNILVIVMILLLIIEFIRVSYIFNYGIGGKSCNDDGLFPIRRPRSIRCRPLNLR